MADGQHASSRHSLAGQGHRGKTARRSDLRAGREWLMTGAPHCTIHPHAAEARGGNQDMSRTKWAQYQDPLAMDAFGLPVRAGLTEGTRADCTPASSRHPAEEEQERPKTVRQGSLQAALPYRPRFSDAQRKMGAPPHDTPKTAYPSSPPSRPNARPLAQHLMTTLSRQQLRPYQCAQSPTSTIAFPSCGWRRNLYKLVIITRWRDT